MTTPCVTPIAGPPVTAFKSLYLGRPGSMSKLRLPDAGYAAGDMSRAEVAHTLLSGGVATTRRRKVKRQWQLSSSGNTPGMADELLTYYSGARGVGPFSLVDPAWRNQLSLDDSTMDVALGAPLTWDTIAADAQPTHETTIVGPLPGSGVLRWPTPVNAHHFFQGTVGAALVPDDLTAVPYLSDQPFTVSIYLRTATSTSTATLYALGCNATTGYDGTSTASIASGTLNTTWKRVLLTVAAGTFTAVPQFVCIDLVCNTASGPDILVAAPQLHYGVTGATNWVTGFGAARVTLAAGVPSKSNVFWRRDHSYTLSEV